MEKRGISAFRKAISLLRNEIHPDLAIQQLAVYTEVCGNEGITMPEIAENLGMPKGSLSRNIKRLSRYVVTQPNGDQEVKGYDLIRTEPDLIERRRLAVYLTKNGKRIWKLLEEIMKEG